MYIIGLTGGISCGKSSVAESLRRYYKALTLDIDEVTHWLSEPGGELFEIYVRHFGKKIVGDAGTLNKKAIGEIIFTMPFSIVISMPKPPNLPLVCSFIYL